MPESTDVIGVMRSHLEQIHAALSNARTREECADLSEALRHGRTQPTPSWLSKQLGSAIQHTEGYLDVEVDEPDE